MATRDAEAVRSYFTADAVHQNTGIPAAVGVDAITGNLAGQMAMFPDSYAYRLINVAGDGDVVLTERLDMIRGADGALHGVPVMGTFVFPGGKISRWKRKPQPTISDIGSALAPRRNAARVSARRSDGSPRSRSSRGARTIWPESPGVSRTKWQNARPVRSVTKGSSVGRSTPSVHSVCSWPGRTTQAARLIPLLSSPVRLGRSR